MSLILLIALFLVWGSFLNVVGYRLIRGQSIITPRSYCPHCKNIIAWYDNIPLLSWLLLRGTCRICQTSISFLYPLIELLTALSLLCLYLHTPITYFPAYFVLFSILIVAIRTDLEQMLLMPYLFYAIIPFAYVASFIEFLPITITQSILGSLIGYTLLWSIAYIFTKCTGKQGIGEGDFDLLASIGAFTGINGVFYSLGIGAWIGSILSILYILLTKQNKDACIPFAPFLALGAMIYVCFHYHIDNALLRYALIY